MLSRIFLKVYRLDSKALATLSFGTLIPYGVVWAEIEYIVHVVLPIGPINQFKPVQQSRQQTPRAYCPNIYFDFSSLIMNFF